MVAYISKLGTLCTEFARHPTLVSSRKVHHEVAKGLVGVRRMDGGE